MRPSNCGKSHFDQAVGYDLVTSMTGDILNEFATLREVLIRERVQRAERLRAINAALGGEIQVPFLKVKTEAEISPMGGEIPVPFGRRKRKMRAAGRKAIAEAARKSWATAKRAGRSRL